MRIALVSLHTSPARVPGSGDAGGMNVVVFEQARALWARGHEVHVVTRASHEVEPGERPLSVDPSTGHAPTPHPNIPAPPLTETALPTETPAPPTLHALPVGDPHLDKSQLPAIVPEFSRALRALGPVDAVHAHYWLSGLAALPLARESDTQLALSLHTVGADKNRRLGPADRPEPSLRLASERALVQRAHVIAGSHSELASLTELLGAPAARAEVIHPGVDTELFRPARSRSAELSADQHAPHGAAQHLRAPRRITVLGRIQPFKGQDLAVRAAAAFAKIAPDLWADGELVIAGEPTPGAEPYAAQLRRLAEENGIVGRVRFLPAQSRTAAAALLASSDVVLVPSRSETFGLVALEAAACGVPSIVAGGSGLNEAAPDGVASLHVADRDPLSWAHTLERLLRDEPGRRALGERAREFALAHDWRAHAAKLEACYRRLRR